jgi:tyrosyl-tRNA synthetase
MIDKVIRFPANAPLPPKGRVKFGIDPTFTRLHLGHLVPLLMVKELQGAGHPVTIVLGTFTAQLGDPSGRDATRPILSPTDVEMNAFLIKQIVEKVLPPGFTFWDNHTEHDKMTLPKFMKLAAQFTLAHMTSRDAFQKRIEAKASIGLHELLVPICQGWDSVVLKAEIEVGGQDQLFNFQVSRFLQEKEGMPPQVCLMSPIIRGTDGRKMSKSLDNCIWLDDPPVDVYGKVMSVPDDVMEEWIPLLSSEPNAHTHPMDRKKALAFDITNQLWGRGRAAMAQDEFKALCQDRKAPTADDIDHYVKGETLVEVVSELRSCSKAEARRLLAGGGVSLDGVKRLEDCKVSSGQIVKVGKRDFVKVSR